MYGPLSMMTTVTRSITSLLLVASAGSSQSHYFDLLTSAPSSANGPGPKFSCVGSDNPTGKSDELQLVFEGDLSDGIVIEFVRGTPGAHPNASVKARRNGINVSCGSGRYGGVISISGVVRADTFVTAHAGLRQVTVRTAKDSARLEFQTMATGAPASNRRCEITKAHLVRCQR